MQKTIVSEQPTPSIYFHPVVVRGSMVFTGIILLLAANALYTNYPIAAYAAGGAGAGLISSVITHALLRCGSKEKSKGEEEEFFKPPTSLFKVIWELEGSEAVECAKELLAKDPNLVHERTELQGLTPLHLAAKTDNRALVELLIEKGADVNAPSKGGSTPLSFAAEGALSGGEMNREIHDLLVEKGAL